MNKTMIRSLFLVLFLLVGTRFAAAANPNIVLIISDDHHWRDYGFMGHPHVQTPHLDKLAKESLVFTRGYVPASLCRPSLATILSGWYPHQHKITSNDPPLPADGKKQADKNEKFLAQRHEMIANIDKCPSLPRMLADKGYVSFQTGKWWEGDFKRGGFTHGMSVGGRHGDKGLEIGRKTMQPMYDFIDDAVKAEKPFLVWYAPMLPHSPHNAEERWLAKYRDKAPNLETAKYWACIDWFDATCGQLLGFLDERKLTESTLVIYVTDNGWLQDPTQDRYAPKSKQSQYDGGIRTPIMMKWPGNVQPRKSEQLAMSIDIVPTVLAAVGLKPAAEMQGVNLLDEPAVSGRKTIFGECFEHNAVDIHNPASSLKYRWCIQGNTKLVLPNKARVPQGEVELFDLAMDADEERNLAAGKAEEVERLTKLLDGWWSGK